MSFWKHLFGIKRDTETDKLYQYIKNIEKEFVLNYKGYTELVILGYASHMWFWKNHIIIDNIKLDHIYDASLLALGISKIETLREALVSRASLDNFRDKEKQLLIKIANDIVDKKRASVAIIVQNGMILSITRANGKLALPGGKVEKKRISKTMFSSGSERRDRSNSQ